MSKATDKLKEFGAGVLGRITDPAQRKVAEDALNSLYSIEPVANAFGDGVAGQSEISRELDRLRAQQLELDAKAKEIEAEEQRVRGYHTELTNWYTTNKERLEAVTKPTPNPAPKPGEKPAEAPVGLTPEELQKVVIGEREGFLSFQLAQNQLQREHFTKFNEVLDLQPLLSHPKIGELGLPGVYQLVNKDRLDKYQADAKTAEENRIRADERQKVLAANAQMPYITPNGVGSGSPLDALSPVKSDGLVDAAAQHYQRLTAERQAREGAA